MAATARRIFWTGFAGTILGAVVCSIWNPLPLTSREETVPAPYRIAKFPGGTGLRMAMVHDVIHERYLKHGAAWYAKRNEEARATIARQHAEPSKELLGAMDDLAVGLDHLHEDEEAAAVMREKLRLLGAPLAPNREPTTQRTDTMGRRTEYVELLELPPLPEKHHAEYTAEANLGTVLIHDSFAKAFSGDAPALAKLREGLAHIDRSIEINPLAHFGRENWQAIVVRHFLACHEHPDLLTTYTMVGDRIAGSPAKPMGRGRQSLYVQMARKGTDNLNVWYRATMRDNIPMAGIDPEWAKIVKPAYSGPMPFDEPVLGLLGMWTLGGGPNPHSAMALARLMEIVGQREIAWNGYERAVEMQDRFSPEPKARAALVAACRARQHAIAQVESPRDVTGWETAIRTKHRAELAFGETYQKDYQDWEQKQIEAGVALADPGFYRDFFRDRPPIASDPGTVDEVVFRALKPRGLSDFVPLLLLGCGFGMVLGYFSPVEKKPRRLVVLDGSTVQHRG